MITVRLISIIIGYICGLFQTSYIYGRMHGIDIREYGSGNAGTTNALRTLGAKAGIVTLLGDAFKCVAAVVIIHLLFGKTNGDIIRLLSLYGAAGAILGHNFPFYLHFRGGKGIAATAGLILTCGWQLTLIEAAVFLAIVLVTHYVSVGSLVVYAVLLIYTFFMGQTGRFGMESAGVYEMYVIVILLAALAVYKHRANIKRLLEGTENKTYLGKKK